MLLLNKDIEQHESQTESLTKALCTSKQHLDEVIASLSQQRITLEVGWLNECICVCHKQCYDQAQIASLQKTFADVNEQYEIAKVKILLCSNLCGTHLQYIASVE